MATLTFDSTTAGLGATTLPAVSFITSSGQVIITSVPVASEATASITATPSASELVTHITATSPTATPSAAPASSSPPLSTLLPAILAPVVFVLALIPILICTYLHFRNKKQREARNGSPDLHGPPAETALLQHKTSRSLTLPSPFSDTDRTQEGALGLYDGRRNSTERRSNGDIVALYDRHSNRGSLDYRRGISPKPPPRAVAAAAANRGPPRNMNKQLPASRGRGGPPPAKPAKAQKQEAQWPLPAVTLPSPNSMHHPDTSKPLPPASSASNSSSFRGAPQLPPMFSSEPFTMREELRPDSETYDLSTSAARNSAKMSKARNANVRNTASTADPFGAQRASDLVSELSDQEGEQFPRRSRRDTDAVSMVSAMTGRSQSGRRKSSASAVSALSPNDEPEMPKPFFRR